MLTLKEINSHFFDDVSRDEMIDALVELVRENDRRTKEEKRFREFEGACLDILSDFAPWAHRTTEGKILGALLKAIDKIQDSREGRVP